MTSICERIKAGAHPTEIEEYYKHEHVRSWEYEPLGEKARAFLDDAADKMSIVAWGAFCPACSDEILGIMCMKSPTDITFGRAELKTLPELLIISERYKVLEFLLSTKRYKLDYKLKALDTTLDFYIMRIEDKTVRERLLKAGRVRKREDDEVVQVFSDVSDLLDEEDTFNLVVIVGGEEVKLHRGIAIKRSEYFKKAMEINMAEAQTGRITLKQDVSVNTIKWIREMMYRGSSKLVSAPEDVFEALQTAGWMQLNFIVIGLVEFIEPQLKLENFWELTNIAYKLDCQELYEVLVDYLDREMAITTVQMFEHPTAKENAEAFVWFIAKSSRDKFADELVK